MDLPRPTGYAHYTLKNSGLSLVPKAFGTSSCILWIYNPAAYPVVKQIFFWITNPHNTYSWDCKSQQPTPPLMF